MSAVTLYDIVWDGERPDLPTTYDLTENHDYITSYNFSYDLVRKVVENVYGHTIKSFDFEFEE